MNQLFADNIRSPAPQPEPLRNPFELSFASPSNTHGPALSSTISSQKASPESDDWLTQRSQQRADSSAHYYTHGERTVLPLRRRANPKLLFMGMRRYVLVVRSSNSCATELTTSVDAASLRFRRLSSRSSRPQIPSTSRLPTSLRQRRCSAFSSRRLDM